jgi:hypothetical protein
MAHNSSPDYKALFFKADEGRKQEKERREQAEKREEQQRQLNQGTTFGEFIRHCHDLFSRPLKVAAKSVSTAGTIPQPIGKLCPTRLIPWEDCPTQQREVYKSVCHHLHPVEEGPLRLFSNFLALKDRGRHVTLWVVSSEQGVENYEKNAVEGFVYDIIAKLCKLPLAKEEFGLGDGIWFDNHSNGLIDVETSDSAMNQKSKSNRPRPDQFCIHRLDGENNSVLTTVEYKPPHKLTVEDLRVGLRPMELWEEVANRNTIPTTDDVEKKQYDAELQVCSAIVQEYHVMIHEGLEYSYLTNGLARVLLYVPYDKPDTLYYYLCEPNTEVDWQDEQSFREPTTSIARVLCLCLMSFRSRQRDQLWRNKAISQLKTWKSHFDHTREEAPEDLLASEHRHSTPETTSSEYQRSSSPLDSPTAKSSRVATRSRAGCAPEDTISHMQAESSESDSNEAGPGRKRGFSQVTSSPPVRRLPRNTDGGNQGSGRQRKHTAQFCTQRCMIGLQQGADLDQNCPNVKLHKHGQNDTRHPVTANLLVQMLKRQLDENLDQNCTPFGVCGARGAPFKLTCSTYGYTVVGKGTSIQLWNIVSREANIYQALRPLHGSAVPVFLGTINLAQIYFLHGAGQIRHMLVMAWGGECIANLKQEGEQEALFEREIARSRKAIRNLGVTHGDLRPENMLWSAELGRVLIIDFDCSSLDRRPKPKRLQSLKRPSYDSVHVRKGKRVRIENDFKQSCC